MDHEARWAFVNGESVNLLCSNWSQKGKHINSSWCRHTGNQTPTWKKGAEATCGQERRSRPTESGNLAGDTITSRSTVSIEIWPHVPGYTASSGSYLSLDVIPRSYYNHDMHLNPGVGKCSTLAASKLGGPDDYCLWIPTTLLQSCSRSMLLTLYRRRK